MSVLRVGVRRIVLACAEGNVRHFLNVNFRFALALSVLTLISSPSVASATEVDDVVRIVVTFESTTVSTDALDDAVGRTDVEYAGAVSAKTRVYELAGGISDGIANEIAALEAVDGVRDVVVDKRVSISAVSTPFYNDPLYADQWHLDSANGIRAPQAWQFTEGAGVTVAVVDTGHTAHPDLDANIINGYDFITDVTTANDGNGRDADARDPGDACTDGGTGSWHGTHISGTIAAVSGNGVGVSGVAPKSKVLSVRALGCNGGSNADVIAGMRWAAGLSVPGVPANTNPAKVINMSLGSEGACDSFTQSAVNEVVAAGALVVVSAGNNNSNAAERSPASCDNVIAVAATTLSGGRASFSNYGAVVDIAAPGVSIMSTMNAGATAPGAPTYETRQGTSTAAPQVSGVAALVLSLQPELTVSELRTRVLSTARAFPSTCSLCGSGLLDAGAAVAVWAGVELPGAPRNFTATQVGETVRLSWNTAASTGTSAVSGYVVRGGTGCDTTALTCVVSGLTVGETVTFTVRARNAKGLGDTASQTLKFIGTPGAPNEPIVTVDGLSAVLLWQTPGFDGGSPVTSYVVTGFPGGSCTTVETTCSITNLQPGATYSFSIAAINIMGVGVSAESRGHQIAGGPASPVSVIASFGETSGLVSWEPGIGGLVVEKFKVTVTPGDATCETTGSRCAVSGLTPGTSYSVSVVAMGPAGTLSTPSSVSVATIGVAPAPAPAPLAPPPVIESSRPVTSPDTSAKTSPLNTVPNNAQNQSANVKAKSRTALTRLVPVGRAKVTWRVSGGCKIAGKVLVAPKKRATCKVVGTFKDGGRKKTVSRIVNIG